MGYFWYTAVCTCLWIQVDSYIPLISESLALKSNPMHFSNSCWVPLHYTLFVACVGLRWTETVKKLAWFSKHATEGRLYSIIWLSYSTITQAGLILSESWFPWSSPFADVRFLVLISQRTEKSFLSLLLLGVGLLFVFFKSSTSFSPKWGMRIQAGNNYNNNSIYRCRWSTGVDTADLSLICRGIVGFLACCLILRHF